MTKPDARRFPFKAIVSPCSECQNFNTDPSTGFPICPRRMLAEQQNEADKNGVTPAPAAYLIESGTDDPDQYANPVYSKSQSSIFIWVAAVGDNRVSFKSDGTLGSCNILNQDAFDTHYTRCMPLPVIPGEAWSSILAKGAYKEWDQLMVLPADEEQEETVSASMTLAPLVKTCGFAQKIDFTFNCDLGTPQIDRIPSGM